GRSAGGGGAGGVHRGLRHGGGVWAVSDESAASDADGCGHRGDGRAGDGGGSLAAGAERDAAPGAICRWGADRGGGGAAAIGKGWRVATRDSETAITRAIHHGGHRDGSGANRTME